MSQAGFRQDMPPKGGYSGITWERIPLKKPWSGLKMFSLYTTVSLFSYWMYGLGMRRKNVLRRENEDVTVAIEPLLIAERDRIYLNQLRKNREEEADLMKNVPGWKVGTYFGEPIYKTIGDNLFDPYTYEYYAHTDEKYKDDMTYYDFWM